MTRNDLNVTHVGGPTLLIEFGGLRLLTDPTFDEAREYVRPGTSTLVKLTPPVLPAEQLEPIHTVLLSHDQHADNLDPAGHR